MTVSCGKVLEYLGMKIDYSNEGKVVFSVQEYVKNLSEECLDDLLKGGTATTPAASHISQINRNAVKLNKEKSDIFHHLMAKLLYLSKRTRPDIQFSIAFLSTRVRKLDINDWKN